MIHQDAKFPLQRHHESSDILPGASLNPSPSKDATIAVVESFYEGQIAMDREGIDTFRTIAATQVVQESYELAAKLVSCIKLSLLAKTLPIEERQSLIYLLATPLETSPLEETPLLGKLAAKVAKIGYQNAIGDAGIIKNTIAIALREPDLSPSELVFLQAFAVKGYVEIPALTKRLKREGTHKQPALSSTERALYLYAEATRTLVLGSDPAVAFQKLTKLWEDKIMIDKTIVLLGRTAKQDFHSLSRILQVGLLIGRQYPEGAQRAIAELQETHLRNRSEESSSAGYKLLAGILGKRGFEMQPNQMKGPFYFDLTAEHEGISIPLEIRNPKNSFLRLKDSRESRLTAFEKLRNQALAKYPEKTFSIYRDSRVSQNTDEEKIKSEFIAALKKSGII